MASTECNIVSSKQSAKRGNSKWSDVVANTASRFIADHSDDANFDSEGVVEEQRINYEAEIATLRKKLKTVGLRLKSADHKIEEMRTDHEEEIHQLDRKHEEDLQEMADDFERFEGALFEELRETQRELADQKSITAHQQWEIEKVYCGVCGLQHRSILFVRCGHLYYCSYCWIWGGELAIQHGCPICGKDGNGQPRCTAWQRVHLS